MERQLEDSAIQYVAEHIAGPAPDYLGSVRCFAIMEGGNRVLVPHVSYHSPSGLEYGYGGSGPADLALSILADWFACRPTELAAKLRAGKELDENERRAAHWHQDFKWKFIAKADQQAPLVIGMGEIVNFVAEQLRAERGIDARQG